MSSKRMYFVMLGIIVLLSLATVATVVVGNSLLENRSKKLNDLKVEDKLLEEQQSALAQANKDIAKYSDLEKVSKSIVPQDKDQAKAVQEVVKYAQESGISIKSITFPSSNLGQKNASSGTQSSDNSSNNQQAQTSPISQAKPVEGIKGVYSLEMTVTNNPTGTDYYQLLNFLGKLESNRRTAQITQLRITPVKGSPYLQIVITLNIFIKP